MEVSTINQLIETGGYITIALIAILFTIRIVRYRESINREIRDVKDIIFLKYIIEKYKEYTKENNGTSLYNTFRKEVIDELNYTPSEFSQKARVEKRLEILNSHSKDIDKAEKDISGR